MSTKRFERDIRLAASLQQANIVPLLSAGEIDGPPHYIMPRCIVVRRPESVTTGV